MLGIGINMNAVRTSWKHLPPPVEREPLEFEVIFTDSEAEQMILGLVPAQMEDKLKIIKRRSPGFICLSRLSRYCRPLAT